MRTTSKENIAMTGTQFETLSLEKLKAINESIGNNNSARKLDFITRLPLELVSDIMKYFEPHELIELFSVSKGWKTCLLGSPSLWSSWNIDKNDYDWDHPSISAVLLRVGQYVSELTLNYSIDLKYFTETLFNYISNGKLNKLETLNLYGCYCSHDVVFTFPTAALLNVADTLKKLEISFDQYYSMNDKIVQGSVDNKIFKSKKYELTAIDAFQSIITVLSTCHQIEYIRYVNSSAVDHFSPSIISTISDNDDSLYSSLIHLEIEMGYTETLYEDQIFKRCPNLRILRLKYARHINVSLLDSIRRHCPYLEYLSFNYHQNLIYGKDLYDEYYPKSSTQNNSNNRTAAKVTSPSSSSSSPTLNKIYMEVAETDHALPFLNHYVDSIEEMGLSFKSGYQIYFESLQLMNQLVSLVVTDIWDPFVLPTLLSKLPSLRNLEIYELVTTSTELIDIFKGLKTLEKLTIHSKPISFVSMGDDAHYYLERAKNHGVDLFNIYADGSMFNTTACSSAEEKEKDSADCVSSQEQGHGGGRLTHVSLSGCEILQDEVLEALGNIKTLSSVFIESAPLLTLQGINRFCEQLNMLPGLFSIELSDIPCVNDSTLFILGLSSTAASISHNITKRITLNSLHNVTEKGLDQLAKKQGVSLISNDCPGTINGI
ncbi:hypothetical protein BDC45DRAFT_324871 [Circinella umbellata]|nr:hypothetical protein BDC45DRAFT_324871 [Circinella umbellata]